MPLPNTRISRVEIVLCFLLLAFHFPGQVRYTTAAEAHRVYSHLLEPSEHPDYARRPVKPPNWDTFKQQTQFTCLRGFNVESNRIVGYAEEIEKFTRTFELGNVLWPSYPILFATNLAALAEEVKRRELYLFDIWGYVPGSGPGGYWQQFKPPQEAFSNLERALGDRWLGTDIGEQDGRYIGGYANQMTPASGSRLEQYFNFQRHFQRMGDDLGHKHAALVSLNFGHYFLKEGTYTLIGAETAQALPNNQVYYSFIRGAGKQYGVPWFGNASIFNRWGFKTYGSSGKSDGYEHGPTKGTSLSLLKRLLYTHILYNSVAVGFENGWFDGEKLSPIGRIQQAAQRWIKENGQPGVMHTPVALLLDFYSGWSFPRHLYSENIYRVWGNLPYQEEDYLTDAVLDLLYPGYQDSSYFHDESGFMTPTPYGDIADALLSDTPGWVLHRYPLVVVVGELRGGAEIRDKLVTYVTSGGHLLITSGNLAKMPGGLLGITEAATTLRTNIGQGRLTILSGGFATEAVAGVVPKSEIDKPIPKPFHLLDSAREALRQAIGEQVLLDVGNPDLSYVTTRKSPGKYWVGVANNTWSEKPFQISSHCGSIVTVQELPMDQSEKTAKGYLPETLQAGTTGQSSSNTIAGGDIRVFEVVVSESGVAEIQHVPPPLAPKGRYLPLGYPVSIQREILSRPTFFEHFDGVSLDWEYLRSRESRSLRRESSWLARQGLRIIVDASSGVNLYPTLRLIDNLEPDYKESIAALEEVIDKMAILGCHDLVLSLHRFPENNFSGEQTVKSFGETLRALSTVATAKGVTLHLRQAFGKPPWNLVEAGQWLDQWKAGNVRLAAATALLPERAPSPQESEVMKRHLGLWLVAGARKDVAGKVWDAHVPIHRSSRETSTKLWLAAFPDVSLALDGIYEGHDEEYLDAVALEQIMKQ